MRKFILSFLIISAIIKFNLYAQTPEEIFKEIEDKSKGVASYIADFEMTSNFGGMSTNASGKSHFKPPDKYRMEFIRGSNEGSVGSLIVSDGATMWQYMPQMNMVQKFDWAKLKEAFGEKFARDQTKKVNEPFRGMDKATLKYFGIENLDGEDVYVFEGKSSQVEEKGLEGFKPGKIKMYIGTNDGILRKMITYDLKDNEMTAQRYKNIKLNQDIPDSTFVFTPPEGIQVVDMTDMMKETFKALQESKDIQ